MYGRMHVCMYLCKNTCVVICANNLYVDIRTYMHAALKHAPNPVPSTKAGKMLTLGKVLLFRQEHMVDPRIMIQGTLCCA